MQREVIVDNELLDTPEVPAAQGTGSAEVRSDTDYSELHRAIRDIAIEKDTPQFDKRRAIRDLVKANLLSETKGFLCQASDGRGFYFEKEKRRLLDLEQRPFQHFLSHVSGLSATESQFRFTLDSLQTQAAQEKPVRVDTLSFYDLQTGRLVVSDGGGGVWSRERGGNWEYGYNGDEGILFLTESDAEPWTPEFNQLGNLRWYMEQFSALRRNS
jgi:hypothetical protein